MCGFCSTCTWRTPSMLSSRPRLLRATVRQLGIQSATPNSDAFDGQVHATAPPPPSSWLGAGLGRAHGLGRAVQVTENTPLRPFRKKMRRGNGGDVVDRGDSPSPFKASRRLLQPPGAMTTDGCPAIRKATPMLVALSAPFLDQLSLLNLAHSSRGWS